jgi:DNA-binding winged helix-turn-helix (wHTH) protein
MSDDCFQFGPFRLNSDVCLSGPRGVVSLHPRALEVLLLLVKKAEQKKKTEHTVSYEDFLRFVWKESPEEPENADSRRGQARRPRAVVVPGLYNHVSHLRTALGDTTKPYKYIQTVPKRGYKFAKRVQRCLEDKAQVFVSPAVTTEAAAVPPAALAHQAETPVNTLPSHTHLPFRNIRHKRWQEIRLAECPHPHEDSPVISEWPPPFQPLPSNVVRYVEGWILCLRANVQYLVTFSFGTSDAWPETEIVLYQRVPDTAVWERDISCGSVTEGECPSDFTPQGEHWLITCWGKKVIDRAAPWIPFVPKTSDLNTTEAVLKLYFSAGNHLGDKARSPALSSATESSPAIWIQALE